MYTSSYSQHFFISHKSLPFIFFTFQPIVYRCCIWDFCLFYSSNTMYLLGWACSFGSHIRNSFHRSLCGRIIFLAFGGKKIPSTHRGGRPALSGSVALHPAAIGSCHLVTINVSRGVWLVSCSAGSLSLALWWQRQLLCLTGIG